MPRSTMDPNNSLNYLIFLMPFVLANQDREDRANQRYVRYPDNKDGQNICALLIDGSGSKACVKMPVKSENRARSWAFFLIFARQQFRNVKNNDNLRASLLSKATVEPNVDPACTVLL